MAKKNRMKPEIELTTEEVKEKLSEKKEEKKPEHKKFAKVKDVDILNIRREPNGEIISQIGKNIPMLINSEFPITDDSGIDWYKVVSPIGVTGFAMSKYLFIYEEGPTKEV